MQQLVSSARSIAVSAAHYGHSSLRALNRGHRRRVEERLVFVVGSPRSGTTFVGGAIGAQPGFVDLGEVKPLKSAIPGLVALPAAERATELRAILERIRRFGLVRGLRAVEQTPETSFVIASALEAYPSARAIHCLRDGRDVVCSLLERGWLSADRAGGDDVGASYGAQRRFWVADDEAEGFAALSDAGRAASAWRHYTTAARAVPERTFELRYESLVADPSAAAQAVAAFLGCDPEPLAEAFGESFGTSVGRWRTELDAGQLADVEAEAGALLRELDYL
jgi:hypothetical protein